jgi:DNA-binding XRE family transcriptional regulator
MDGGRVARPHLIRINAMPGRLATMAGMRANVADTKTRSQGETSFAGRAMPPEAETEFLVLLGDRVRATRLLRDMSRRELARKARVSERYIAQIEAGKGNVSIMLLLRIAQAIRSE